MKHLFYLLTITFFISCNNNKSFEDKESLTGLKNELISKFGENAYYTKLSITNHENGSIVSVSQTDDPSSLKMTEWNYTSGSWNQISDVTLEISGNAKAEDFMFQLNKVIDFNTLAKVLEEAKQKVIIEKNIEDIKVKSILINAPNDGDFNSMKYFITISPKSGGTSFNFWYKMDGTLDKFDY